MVVVSIILWVESVGRWVLDGLDVFVVVARWLGILWWLVVGVLALVVTCFCIGDGSIGGFGCGWVLGCSYNCDNAVREVVEVGMLYSWMGLCEGIEWGGVYSFSPD